MFYSLLSRLLFALFLADIKNYFLDREAVELNKHNIYELLILLYADNILILAHSEEDLLQKIKILEEYSSINRVTISVSKTKILPFAKGGHHNPGIPFEVEGTHLENAT